MQMLFMYICSSFTMLSLAIGASFNFKVSQLNTVLSSIKKLEMTGPHWQHSYLFTFRLSNNCMQWSVAVGGYKLLRRDMQARRGSAGSCTLDTTTPGNVMGLGQSVWKTVQRKRDWGVGRHLAEHWPAVCTGRQEGLQCFGLYQK